MANIRNKTHPKGFTLLDNRGLTCPDISFRATGLWAYIKSKPDDWEIAVSHLAKQKSEGRDAIYKAIAELIDAGLVVKTQSRVGGRFGEFSYDFYDFPQTPLPEKPDTAKPDTAKPLPENPPQVNKDLPITDLPITDSNNYSEGMEDYQKWLRDRLESNPNVRSVDAVLKHILAKGELAKEYEEYRGCAISEAIIDDVLVDILCLT